MTYFEMLTKQILICGLLAAWTAGAAGAGAPYLVADIDRTAQGSDPDSFIELDGRVYFSAFHPASGRELWTSDGTEDGTRLVKDIFPGEASSEPSERGPGAIAVALALAARRVPGARGSATRRRARHPAARARQSHHLAVRDEVAAGPPVRHPRRVEALRRDARVRAARRQREVRCDAVRRLERLAERDLARR